MCVFVFVLCVRFCVLVVVDSCLCMFFILFIVCLVFIFLNFMFVLFPMTYSAASWSC